MHLNKLLIILIASIMLALIFLPYPVISPEQLLSVNSKPTPVKLSFVGDIMLDRGVRGKVNKYGNGDFNWLFQNAGFLKEADITFGNLEGPVSDRGRNVGSIYSFRFDPIVMSVLKNAGFDVLSMANNHIGDWTRDALEDTIMHGKNAGLKVVGGGMTYEEAKIPKMIEVRGVRVGYLAFSDFGPESILLKNASSSPGVLSASDPNLADIISNADKQVDILVVSYHFGDEYKPLSNNRQKYLARLAVDSGAEIVAGHHPHVSEEIEEYNGSVIVYSLGNFIFDQNFSPETMQGSMLNVTVSKDGILSYSVATTYLNDNYQPYLKKDVILEGPQL